MSLKFEIIENVSEGLDTLQSRISDEMEHILNEMAYAATGYEDDETAPIPSRMSTEFNPYLFLSGQLKQNREVNITPDKSEITVKYSGLGLEEMLGSSALVWWEFSEELDPGLPMSDRTLARDYAFYQETGVDKIARPRGAKHKYAIQRGLYAAHKDIGERAAREFKMLLNKV
jgi:hypothetical protein